MKKIKQEYIIESSSENKSKSQKELAEQFQSPIYKYNKLKQIMNNKIHPKFKMLILIFKI